MKKAMQMDKVGLPLFQLMGNHDNKVIAVSKNDYTVAHDIAAQRNFEYIFGPVNYSFDRGNVHIVAMDNIIFPSHKDYSLGFRDDQVEWLRQDLSYVSKDKMVIFCVHIPMRASNNQNVQAVLELLKPFAEVHIMSGHTHYAENNTYDSHYEHVHGAACGAWWHSTINTDGTPNGYAIYKVKGATIHWVDAATALDAEVRVYSELFSDPAPDGADKDFLACMNPDSLEVLAGCKVAPRMRDIAAAYDKTEKKGKTAPSFQFMRLGYFCLDNKDCSEDHLVFNRSVTLKDSFRK